MPHVRPRHVIAPLGLAACAVAAVGCQTLFLVPPSPKTIDQLLTPAVSSGSVTLEIFQARIPLEKEAEADALWSQVDEQCFDVELRKRLLANGLRAGVVGVPLPETLSDLMALECKMPETSTKRVITGQSAVPQVTRRVVQINDHDQSTIQASELRDEAQVLTSENGVLNGRTYKEVQGVYGLRAKTVPGQRVRLDLVPELQHGELKNRRVGNDQGIFLITQTRDREVFDRLAMEVELAPGEILVLGCLPDATTSLGGTFHTAEIEGRSARKLILVRALETPPSEILAKK